MNHNFNKRRRGRIVGRLLTGILVAALLVAGGFCLRTQTSLKDLPATAWNLIQAKINPAVIEENTGESKTVSKNFDLSSVTKYKDQPYVEVNDNKPFFKDSDYTRDTFEKYSSLDALGRCGTAFANICEATMPDEERGEIGSVKPTGWHTVKYQGIDGNYLYNRCHLIGYQLAGENATEENLITGTRYLNVEGMLPFENEVANFVRYYDGHVLYRVTPVFEGDNLLASGVLMEASSVEDKGKSLQFCVYCYNVQPNVTIDYATGKSSGPEYTGESTQNTSGNTSDNNTSDSKSSGSNTSDGNAAVTSPGMNEDKDISKDTTYVLNTNTRKFHKPDCKSVKQMANRNLKESTQTREELIEEGYDPCGNCNP